MSIEALEPVAKTDRRGLDFDPDALREKYRQERDKRLRADANAQYVEVAGDFRHYVDDPYIEAPIVRGAVDRHGRRPGDRRRFRRPARGRAAARGGRREDPRPRERRRLRRHLVLEPLSRRAVRYRELHLPAAAGRDRLRPAREVQLRPGDPRSQPPDRRTLRPLPRRLLPDRDPRDPLAGRREALAGHHQPRRRDEGALCGDVQRAAEPAEAAGHSGDRDLQGPLVPHQPVGLRLHRRNSYGNLDKLADKTVAIIGTGATAIQCVPHLGAAAKQLYVFQRTPSSVDLRGNRPTDPDWAASLEPAGRSGGWRTSTSWSAAGRRTRTWSATAGPTSSAA